MNIPYFTVSIPLQNIMSPVKKDLFHYKILEQNLVSAEATEGISEDSFLKSSFLRITPPCNTSNSNQRNEFRDRFVSQIVINWIGRIVARNRAIGRIRKHSNKMFHRTIEHPHTTKLLRCAPKRHAPNGLISTRPEQTWASALPSLLGLQRLTFAP